MARYESTFAKLLLAAKEQLKSTKTNHVAGGLLYPKLNKVKTFKIGPITPQAVFPAIVLVPETKTTVRWLNGGKRRVARAITAYVYVRQAKSNLAREWLPELVNDIRESFQTNPFLLDRVGTERTYGVEFGPVNIEELAEPKPSMIWTATLPIILYSTEQMPSRLVSPVYAETTQKELLAEIEAKFRAKEHTEFRKLNSMYFWHIPPIPVKHIPALVIVEPGEVTEPIFTGADSLTRVFESYLYFPWNRDESTLLDMLDTSEEIEQFLYENNRFSDLAIDTEMGQTDFGTADSGGTMVYQATLPFACRCREENVYNA